MNAADPLTTASPRTITLFVHVAVIPSMSICGTLASPVSPLCERHSREPDVRPADSEASAERGWERSRNSEMIRVRRKRRWVGGSCEESEKHEKGWRNDEKVTLKDTKMIKRDIKRDIKKRHHSWYDNHKHYNVYNSPPLSYRFLNVSIDCTNDCRKMRLTCNCPSCLHLIHSLAHMLLNIPRTSSYRRVYRIDTSAT